MPAPSEPKHVSILSEIYPPKSKWSSDEVPDLTGQTIIVTGGNSGIGKETCRILLSKNARIYMAARSEGKARPAIEEITKSTGKTQLFFLKLDLADLPAVRKAAEEFLSKEEYLHVLGVMTPPMDDVTAQGYDSQFGTNVLGHFFFTTLLLPVLLRTAASSTNPTHKARIVNVSSNAHELMTVPGGINWDSLRKGEAATPARRKLGKNALYGQSKLGDVLFSNELARRYGNQGIVSNSLNPGGVRTELQRHVNNPIARLIISALVYDVSYGVLTQLYLGTAPEALEMNGQVRKHAIS
ncbi:hypothetical protein EW146_g3938 [Bondarzewia mesenterica]|uniref:NAD(P)-binding protein n=1 Tax=Bondarzewia mesenterica TaxID=1095465 RepID=A0A4S4M1W2_9AGAM|nr:hypothetical protein EW146_g3938 [Bondarzewia mesenterica]